MVGGTPRSAIVAGAGIVGLSTAWFLQERGVDVTMVDRVGVAAGASWGNAGYIAPALAIPLNEPRTLRYALRVLPRTSAPVRISMSADPALWRFLIRFVGNCRNSSWRRAVRANRALSDECIDAYDALVSHGVDAPVNEAPITALFRTSHDAEHHMDELRRFQDAGQPMSVTQLTGATLREQVPLASEAVTVGLRIDGQRYVDAGRFVTALGRSVVERGATLHIEEVADIAASADGVKVATRDGPVLSADVAVVATGAWLPRLVRRWVRIPVQAGRGYSFTVPVGRPVACPIHLPDARVACTPLGDKLRVTGTMELRDPDLPASEARADAIAEAARPYLDGVRWEQRSEVWVGPRPLSPDGRPLIGQVTAGVYVAGGHGMWGMTHGPATGRMLAEHIATGKQAAALREFDPTR
ncbi:NAD(P)/FAD-dependent oxidoreductase [Mycobacterium shimoidei]|uniref:NAD(P)/FAD-dependent oxidoreductase n=1 Tax=Mycobacterium shimoidei TaxID=29313 RepID=UPI000848611F|nr:FAD-dependent oxidoreductase [Mycobacterium shimoidei]MCV7257166.1 FAD-binding oxidoreductase [Mycobacterium shimoidei]ODR14538.1 amino acid dehydrogenase [Mycobacterium shimoidei]ORW80654.1 amino acid dehydrogenase [Mycobacterium shimoidei]